MGVRGKIAASMTRGQIGRAAANELWFVAFLQLHQLLFPLGVYTALIGSKLEPFAIDSAYGLMLLSLPMVLLAPLSLPVMLLRRRVQREWNLERSTGVVVVAFRANGIALMYGLLSVALQAYLSWRSGGYHFTPFPPSPVGQLLLLFYTSAMAAALVGAWRAYHAKILLDALPFARSGATPRSGRQHAGG